MPDSTAVAEAPAVTRPGAAPAARRTRKPGHLPVHLILLIGALLMVLPFVWELVTSLKTYHEAISVPPTLWPHEFAWSNYSKVLGQIPFGSMFLNSVLLTLGRTAGQLVTCSLAGYVFARLRFPGRGILFAAYLSVLMIPGQLLLIPQYDIMQGLHWLNSIQAVVVPGMFSAFGTFLLRQFFLSMPDEIEEAARLDGAGPVRVFWNVMLPLARPGLVALGLITMLWSWNDLLWPLIVNTDTDKMPLSAGLATLQGQYSTDFGVLMAGALMASAPMIIAFVFLQRHFIKGIALSAGKG
ncbi:carbohydrate ABC transporter permease [Actinocatenispora rupis]|uniref:Sugar ABC transporter permease n=1 Tax=Actinocatenispora rupis TaxID=519421 RepID=A0A8J3J6Q6_9ACTN|nr:carbohydrate ABC transporter permease [Actinocatenispora rupis]GID09558.1 sugar ABC transporter permease [Actinocatenispora rupis]